MKKGDTNSCKECGTSYVMRTANHLYCGSVHDKTGCSYQRNLNRKRMTKEAATGVPVRRNKYNPAKVKKKCIVCNSEYLASLHQVYCKPACAIVNRNNKAAETRKKYYVKEKPKQKEKPVKIKRERYEVYYSEPKIKKCDFGGCGNKFTAYKISDTDCHICELKQKKIKQEAMRYNKGDNYYDDMHLHPQEAI